jgi:hypothetical protein
MIVGRLKFDMSVPTPYYYCFVRTEKVPEGRQVDQNVREQNTGEAPICLVISRASNLCDDLYEDHEANVDVHGDISVPIPQVKSTRKKKSYDKTKVRRSDRIKFKRNNTRS